jgi:hypothetical protein
MKSPFSDDAAPISSSIGISGQKLFTLRNALQPFNRHAAGALVTFNRYLFDLRQQRHPFAKSS